ncbi:MAG: hypothetical protein KF778_13490 [Rhodocyclaceae bacterium]|nr:hypothetical protein [Rhodocyclaceae bacterium]MBX3669409.1 hypothetical protein [Rhodocyclaceae bacterium]
MKSIKLLFSLLLCAATLSACIVVPAEPPGYGHHHRHDGYDRDYRDYRGDRGYGGYGGSGHYRGR